MQRDEKEEIAMFIDTKLISNRLKNELAFLGELFGYLKEDEVQEIERFSKEEFSKVIDAIEDIPNRDMQKVRKSFKYLRAFIKKLNKVREKMEKEIEKYPDYKKYIEIPMKIKNKKDHRRISKILKQFKKEKKLKNKIIRKISIFLKAPSLIKGFEYEVNKFADIFLDEKERYNKYFRYSDEQVLKYHKEYIKHLKKEGKYKLAQKYEKIDPRQYLKIVYDRRSGNYIFQWKSYKKGEKISKFIYRPGWDVKRIIRARVEYNSNFHIYKYEYEIENVGEKSIKSFYLYYSGKIFEGGYKTGSKKNGEIGKFYQCLFRALPEKIWKDKIYAWTFYRGIKANTVENEVFIKSANTPGIVKCSIIGQEYSTIKGEVPDIFRFPLPLEQSIKGLTIGPSSVYNDNKKHIKKIIYYNNKSFELGWIENKKEYKKVESLLKEIQSLIKANKKNEARDKIIECLKIINNAKSFLSEAVGLLKYNLLELKRRLKK